MTDPLLAGVACGEILESLENLMAEFFSPATGNERKREIEDMLKSFDKQQNSWKYCLYFIKQSDNQYVSMFGLSTIENIINRRWGTLSLSEKDELRVCLWECYTNSFPKSPSFIRNKLAKLIVDIAKFAWPATYPTFFNEILELLNNGGATPILGLILIQAFAEGMSNESSLSLLYQERRQELNQLLSQCVPQLFVILIDILNKYALDQSLDKTYPNPPPTPERGPGSSVGVNAIGFPDLLISSQNKTRYDNQEHREECIKMSMTALQNLFSCLPQTSTLPSTILPSLFHWASIASLTDFSEDVCVVAMSVVNEILYQRRATGGSNVMSRLVQETFKLLHHITSPPQSPIVKNLSQVYVDKISEYLQLFISMYFKKLDTELEFDPMEFLLLLFHFTFQVPMCSSFINCLDIWLYLIDGFKPQDAMRFSEALLGLVSNIMNKIQFQHNSSQLEQLDNESTNDDGETEWQVFLRNCIESIAKVAEMAPLHMFKLIQNIWYGLAESHDNGTATERILFDLTSLTQLLGRLAPTLFQDKEENNIDQCIYQANVFLEQIMKVLHHANNVYLNSAQSRSKAQANAYIQVYAGVLACLGSWAHYMPRCQIPVSTVPTLLQIGASILLNKNEQMNFPMLSHAAAHMILSIVVSIRPSNPLQLVDDLYLQAQCSLAHLQSKTAGVVRQALCMMILECPMDEGGGNVDIKRQVACASLIEAWCSPLLSASNGPPSRRLACLPALTQVLNYFSDHPTHTKKLLANAIERPVQAALEIFQNCYHEIDYKDVNVAPLVLDLFLALLHSLHQQLGNTFIRNSTHLFLEVAKRKEQGALQQLLKVLKAAVEGGALSNSLALEEVLSMTIEHILPVTQSNTVDIDIVYALFELFGSILLNKWQHFYSSCVRQGWSPVAPDGSSDGAKANHLSHFRAIMFAFSETMLTDNIEVVRLNLRTIDCLNIRYKLYSKIVFRQELLPHMLGILIKLLIYRTAVGTLLQEEVCTTCQNLAAVDFPVYFDSFLPTFLTTIPQLSPMEIQQLLNAPKDTDLPTFTQNLLRLTSNIRCYQAAKEPA